jgi:hypothetical protein
MIARRDDLPVDTVEGYCEHDREHIGFAAIGTPQAQLDPR